MLNDQLKIVSKNLSKTNNQVVQFESDFKAKGRFRLLFTFGERVLETAFYTKAVKLVSESPLDLLTILLTPEEDRTTEQQELHNAAVYLTMREDFKDAGEIKLDDPAVAAALTFYVTLGIVTETRKNEILGIEE
ncbi:hypothetical protein CL653_03500 [bacterium]|nr:hypothetical protein [bacterium]|tara:strand:- start:106 stop:507 length:402 start_codon:yes stop_codon:yes gene_type:complete